MRLTLSTKRFGPISTSHRNWRAAQNPSRDSKKCSVCHGYSRYVQLTFEGDFDRYHWIMDFGDLKEVKAWFDTNWDHHTIIASDDPQLDFLRLVEQRGLLLLTVVDVTKPGWGASIEGNCRWVCDELQKIIDVKTQGRVKIVKVEIWEHENNSASYCLDIGI